MPRGGPVRSQKSASDGIVLAVDNPRGVAVAGALRLALGRLQPHVGSIARPNAAFGPLGEALFWLCSLDQLLIDVHGSSYEDVRDKDPDGRLVPGLRFARNRVAHGVEVASVSEINPENAVLGLGILGQMRLGTPANLTWSRFDAIPLPPPKLRRPAQEASYQEHLAGKAVFETVEDGVQWLRSTAGV